MPSELDIPISINEAAKRIREVNRDGGSHQATLRVYDIDTEMPGQTVEVAIDLLHNDYITLADWFLEAFPEVG